MFSSIRTKLTITYIVLLVVVMVSASFFLLNLLKNYYFSYQQTNMMAAAKVVRDLVAPKLQAVPDVVDISNQAELVARQSRSRILITDDRQRVLGDSVRVEGLVGTVLNRPEITHALLNQHDKSWSLQYSETGGFLVMQVAVPIEVDGKILGAVFVSSSMQAIDELQKDIRNYLLLITLLAILTVSIIGRFLANKITGPIQSLSEATEKMARGDLSQRVPVRSRDEIGRLTRQFNEMAAQLQENTRKLKEFVADASHEMRTPLTSLNILVKSMRDFPLEPEEREEFLDDIDQELERLIRLVENLLDLTRLDKLATEETMTVADVVPTIRQTLEMLQKKAEEKEIDFRVFLPKQAAPVFAVLHQIKQVVFNLVDNAIKYTPAGGKITVTLTQESDCLKLIVTDNGIGIPPEHREKVFERFYRVDKARSREQGGTGLGLAIVREIVRNHGGQIWIEDGPDGKGSKFVVTIPRASLPAAD